MYIVLWMALFGHIVSPHGLAGRAAIFIKRSAFFRTCLPLQALRMIGTTSGPDLPLTNLSSTYRSSQGIADTESAPVGSKMKKKEKRERGKRPHLPPPDSPDYAFMNALLNQDVDSAMVEFKILEKTTPQPRSTTMKVDSLLRLMNLCTQP